MIFSIIIIFLAFAFFPFILGNEKNIRIGAVVGAISGSAAVFYYFFGALFFHETYVSDWWRLDAFSSLMAFLIAFVYLMAILVSYRYIGQEYHEKAVSFSQVRTYFSLIQIFVLSMIITVLTNNSMALWIALESTTLSSTFLVGLYKKRTSIEAAWKYIILCSTGITLGLVGVLLINYSAHLILSDQNVFMLTFLAENSARLSPEIIKWSFVFIFIGFGTKVGLAPMHAWLPDAHSKAPSPISAIFSGILLNVALYVIIRFKYIVDGALGNADWTNKFFLVFGLISIILVALALLVQRNYKRMLAYSSIEHMGLISIAVAFPPFGMIAAVMHMIGHTIIKSALFFGAGEFLLIWQTTKIDKIKNLMKHAPYSGTLFLLGILAIIATPTSILFSSEYILFTGMFMSHPTLALVVLLVLGLIAFSMLRLVFRLLFGEKGEEKPGKEKWNLTHTVMSVQILLAFGLTFILTTSQGIEFINNLAAAINI